MVALPSLSNCTGFSWLRMLRRVNAWVLYFIFIWGFVGPGLARAQLSQPFVYLTGGAVATRNDQSGALNPIQGSPFAILGFPAAIDAKGRFIFAAGANSVHMYAVDATTGEYAEVAGSPFASANTSSPSMIATEPSGAYIAVVDSVGEDPGESGVETFQIDATGQTLVPVAGSYVELESSPVGSAANAAQGLLFVYLGPNLDSPSLDLQHDGELLTYAIDSTTGLLTEQGAPIGSSNVGRAMGSDPLGDFVVTGAGQFGGILNVVSADGGQGTLNLGPGVYPQEIFVGPGQRFVYATLFSGPKSEVHIYIVDSSDWSLTEAPSSPLPGFTSVDGLVADPSGPFVYQSTGPNQVQVYSVDVSTGYLVPTGGPIVAAGMGAPIAFSVNAGSIQADSGPVATVTPAIGLTFSSTAVGAQSVFQTLTLSSTGNQSLIVNNIQLVGANAGDFSIESMDCGVPGVMKVGATCDVSIIFAPTASGQRQALLVITDNAAGSPQAVPLLGTGAGSPQSAPVISFSPANLSFAGPVNLGSPAGPMAVSVVNSGNAPLSISIVALGGSNPADFNTAGVACAGVPIAANASCEVMVTFTPTAAGARSATLTFTDNAAGSPHVVALSGMGAGTTAPSLRFLPTPANFPAITQGLTSTPLSVTVSNSGNAPLHITGISAGGSSPGNFVNNVSACVGATVAPGAVCAVSMSVSPTAAGTVSETLSVTDDAPGSPQVLSVTANAVAAFSVTSPAAAMTAAVSAGQTATYALQLTPGVDFNGTVAFACSGAPVAAVCQAPAAVTLNIGTPVMMNVSVATSGKSLMPPQMGWRRPTDPFALRFLALWGVFYVALAVAMAGLVRANAFQARSLRTATMMAVWLLMILPVASAMEGCGGVGTSTTPSQGTLVTTPSGTSTIVLTPTGTSLSGRPLQFSPISLTLVVN